MKILAVETSTNYLCLALSDGRRDLFIRLETGRKLSSMLVPVIARAVSAAGWKLSDIDCFGCGIGPGSFTAVRIGMAAVKAFAWSLHRPVVGVTSLSLIAACGCAPDAGALTAVIDAKRSMVYAQDFTVIKGQARPAGKPQLVTAEAFAKKIHKKRLRAGKKCILVGDGIPVVQAALARAGQGWGKFVCADRDHWYPQPQHLLEQVRRQAAAAAGVDAKTIEPLYLYPPECQVRTA